jgi:hypothetical protein
MHKICCYDISALVLTICRLKIGLKTRYKEGNSIKSGNFKRIPKMGTSKMKYFSRKSQYKTENKRNLKVTVVHCARLIEAD